MGTLLPSSKLRPWICTKGMLTACLGQTLAQQGPEEGSIKLECSMTFLPS